MSLRRDSEEAGAGAGNCRIRVRPPPLPPAPHSATETCCEGAKRGLGPGQPVPVGWELFLCGRHVLPPRGEKAPTAN